MCSVFKKIWSVLEAAEHRGALATPSGKWKTWRTVSDPRRCPQCGKLNGQIFEAEAIVIEPPLHNNCRCSIDLLQAILCGTVTIDGWQGADDVLMTQGRLPNHYLLKAEAKKRGWKPGKNTIVGALPGYLIGGNVYDNDDGKLLQAPGRTWYEADMNYVSGPRSAARLLYSNDGLFFVTYDHYGTFYEVVLY